MPTALFEASPPVSALEDHYFTFTAVREPLFAAAMNGR